MKGVRGGNVSYSEFLTWLGIWFKLATIPGFKRTELWSDQPMDNYGAPYRLTNIIEVAATNRY